MRFSSAVRLTGPGRVALFFVATALAACSYEADDPGGGGNFVAPKETVAFDEDGTLEMMPSEVRELHLTTDPGVEIRLLLLGDAYDGSLDQGVIIAGEDGAAKVKLKAPSKPSSFHVVAHVGQNASDDLPVAVSELGFGTVRVKPDYTGSREIDEWTASVSVGLSCAEVTSHFPIDPPGSLGDTAPPTEKPVIKSVPVGPTLAVAVRSGGLMWGCTEVALTTPKTTTDVVVTVTDRPMVLDAAAFDLTLGFAPNEASYHALVGDASTVLIDAAFPDANTATNLLDAMREKVPTASQADFDYHRTNYAVDAALTAGFAANQIDPRVVLASWAAAVVAGSPSPDLAISGTLIGSKETPGAPVFQVLELGPVKGGVAGVPDMIPLNWLSQPGDTVIAGGDLVFSPTRYAGALMESQGIAATPSATTAPEALASILDCASIGAIAGGFAGCDAACGEALCVEGLGVIWQRGLAVKDGAGSVEVAISASAKVSEEAVPISLDGSWVGGMSGLGTTCQMMGEASAVAIPPP